MSLLNTFFKKKKLDANPAKVTTNYLKSKAENFKYS